MAEVLSNEDAKFRRIPFTLNNQIANYLEFHNRVDDAVFKENVAGNNLAIFDIIVTQEYNGEGLYCKIKLNCTSQMFPEINITNCSAGIVNTEGTVIRVIHISDKAVRISKEDTGAKREISSNANWFHCNLPLIYETNWLVDGALNIRVTGYIEVNIEDTPLIKELKNLINDEETSDFKIYVDEKVFYCHKIIFMCYSPVFKTMLTTDMKEKTDNSVTITDTDPDAFEKFLQFLYTDTVTFDSPSTAPDLLYLAEKYDVESLKKFCELEMMKNITTANCLDYCISGFTSNSQPLYENALAFITSKLTDIIKTEEWEQKMKNYPDILLKLVRNMVENTENNSSSSALQIYHI